MKQKGNIALLFAIIISFSVSLSFAISGCLNDEVTGTDDAFRSKERVFIARGTEDSDQRIAERFAVRRFHGRTGEEIVFNVIEKTCIWENNAYEVFLKCLDTGNIERVLVYVEDGKPVRYEYDGTERYVTGQEVAEDFAIIFRQGRTFEYHYLIETFIVEDNTYEVILGRQDNDEVERVLVYVEDGEVVWYKY